MDDLTKYFHIALLKEWLQHLPHDKADEFMITVVTAAMADRLKEKRGEGGWHTQTPAVKEAAGGMGETIRAYVDKGDWIEVMNLSAMAYMREQIYGPQ